MTLIWNGGDSDIHLESDPTLSSFLIKLLKGEWRAIHHGQCQNGLKHYRDIILLLLNMSAVAYS